MAKNEAPIPIALAEDMAERLFKRRVAMVVWDEDFAVEQLERMMRADPNRVFTDHVMKVQAEVAQKLRQNLDRFVGQENNPTVRASLAATIATMVSPIPLKK